MVLGYLRVSTTEQDLSNQKNTILQYANASRLIVDEFVQIEISSRKGMDNRKISELVERLQKGDMLIVTELSRIGRSVSEVVHIINELIDAGVQIVSLKENINIQNEHSLQSKVIVTMFSLFAELERDLISKRTKEALSNKKAQGIKLGRPKGPSTSKLDKYRAEIESFVQKKVSLLSISKILGVSYSTLHNYVYKHNLKTSKVS